MFAFNEAKRQLSFERKQRVRRDKFYEQEDLREIGFRDAQVTRETAYIEGEAARESAFRAGEKSREQEFRLAETRRDNMFYSEQERLRCECYESERSRVVRMENWAESMMQDRERKQFLLYNSEEREQNNEFKRWIELSPLRKGILIYDPPSASDVFHNLVQKASFDFVFRSSLENVRGKSDPGLP